MNSRQIGSCFEEKAAEFLKNQGYQIIEKNYRCRRGEIDLIAKEGEYLVFVEVKYRADKTQGGALEAVTPRKQKRISRTALYYLAQKVHREDIPCRFDVVGIEGETLTLVRNAFDYCG